MNAAVSRAVCTGNHEEVLAIVDEKLDECKGDMVTDIQALKDQVTAIHTDIAHMREILDAWNSAKGFVNTIKFLAALTKALAALGAVIGIIWYVTKFGHMPPTGGN